VSGPRHAPPFFCPYCGEERIRPYGEEPAQYGCSDCLRVFTLRLTGSTAAPDPAPASRADP